ncbi:MAG: zinc-binding dehydrogenase [Armatimonadetes bacterium]|nr:zinc-binding dehydrogenase [Armatimonadota bacterium]
MLGQSQVTVEDFPDPRLGEGEVLIRIQASALCGSELHGYRGDTGQEFNGGHEAMGVVAEALHTRYLKPGDRVGIHAVWGCGQCRWCASGRYTFCDQRRGTPGTHAELVSAPEHVLLKLEEDISDEVGVLLSGDGLGVPYHVSTRLNTRGGDVVCVIGAGPIGLGNVLIQSFLGAEVVVIDLNDYRLGLARDLGAKHTVNSQTDDAVEAVRQITSGSLADKCIECVGRPETLKLALRLVGKAGTVMAVGEQGDVPLSISEDLIRRDITLMGSWFFHYCEFGAMVNLYRRGLRVDKLVTHRFPLEEAPLAFSEFSAGRTGKVVLQPCA